MKHLTEFQGEIKSGAQTQKRVKFYRNLSLAKMGGVQKFFSKQIRMDMEIGKVNGNLKKKKVIF